MSEGTFTTQGSTYLCMRMSMSLIWECPLQQCCMLLIGKPCTIDRGLVTGFTTHACGFNRILYMLLLV